jgi:hypothetical protein
MLSPQQLMFSFSCLAIVRYSLPALKRIDKNKYFLEVHEQWKHISKHPDKSFNRTVFCCYNESIERGDVYPHRESRVKDTTQIVSLKGFGRRWLVL